MTLVAGPTENEASGLYATLDGDHNYVRGNERVLLHLTISLSSPSLPRDAHKR